MDDQSKDPDYRLQWDDHKESTRMWAVLTAVFAACAVIGAVWYHYDADQMQVASNNPMPPATLTPFIPTPVPTLPQ
jgi:hypothetical protein